MNHSLQLISIAIAIPLFDLDRSLAAEFVSVFVFGESSGGRLLFVNAVEFLFDVHVTRSKNYSFTDAWNSRRAEAGGHVERDTHARYVTMPGRTDRQFCARKRANCMRVMYTSIFCFDILHTI